MKKELVSGDFMGAYYVEEKYARQGRVRRRFWFSKVDDSTLQYEGGMSYVNKRRVLSYDEPPSFVSRHAVNDGYKILDRKA